VKPIGLANQVFRFISWVWFNQIDETGLIDQTDPLIAF